ncbi:hypothetical protein PDR5_29780 [Pseudomonas sp. DR 5-09]|nr:hypothetical protein PDR5_29780 [Pseudomonas sp. DR 5-09]
MFVAQNRQWMAGGIQYRDAQRFDPGFPSKVDGGARYVRGGKQIQSLHGLCPHTAHLPN